jgi:hypothetical protein
MLWVAEWKVGFENAPYERLVNVFTVAVSESEATWVMRHGLMAYPCVTGSSFLPKKIRTITYTSLGFQILDLLKSEYWPIINYGHVTHSDVVELVRRQMDRE